MTPLPPGDPAAGPDDAPAPVAPDVTAPLDVTPDGGTGPPLPDEPLGVPTTAIADAGNPALADVGTRLIAGEPTAIEDAYRLLGPLVVGYLRRYVPADDVEDVCQRVFYELWRVHERFDPSYSLRTWVIGIARKRAIDHLRKRREQVVTLDAVREVAGDDGRETAERLVWADELHAALASLPEAQRQVIELAYFQGLTQSEVAGTLGIPLGTVKTRTARGMQRLAALLEDPDANRVATGSTSSTAGSATVLGRPATGAPTHARKGS